MKFKYKHAIIAALGLTFTALIFPTLNQKTDGFFNTAFSAVSSSFGSYSGLSSHSASTPSSGRYSTNVTFSPTAPQNFTEAKQVAKQIYSDHRYTFYCGCKFDKHGKVDLHSCGYKIQNDARRARRLEWEHIVPVSRMASHLPCWKNKLCSKERGGSYGGRNCCREIDPAFVKMEADLHNLVPEIGELNACRSNFRFGMLPFVKPGQFGECSIKIDKETRRVEPDVQVRGMIARVYLYIEQTYHLRLSDSQLQLFRAWNKLYPPEPWEIERDRRIYLIQGNHNPFVLGLNQ